jgi:hypothetical protein
VNRSARIMSAAHGGQILASGTAVQLAGATAEFRSLGMHGLKGLSGACELFQVAGDGLQAEFPPLSTLDVVRHNLPVQRTDLLGRDKDIERVVGALSGTRLALAAAAEVALDFTDGVFLVDLSLLTEPGHVAGSVAAAVAASVAASVGLQLSTTDSASAISAVAASGGVARCSW